MTVTIKEFLPEDAAAVARLFYASDRGWPEGFGDGILYPADLLLQELREEKDFNLYLAWEDGKAIGFASLNPHWEEDRAAYVGLLTADPDYHGRGAGRDLMRTVVHRCVELDLKRVDLDTWPGNTKAVPMYKKTGYWWGPEGEQLQNHMPLLLAHPLTRSYFERHDWYSTRTRNLRMGPDEDRRNGALVFPYLWDNPNDSLHAIFDQKTKKLVELDTPELLLSLETDGIELLRDRKIEARLRVANRLQKALTIAVTVSGKATVKTEHYQALTIEPGGEDTVSFTATSSGEATGEGSVELNLLVDGHRVEMAATLKVVTPLELSLEPAAPAPRPSRPATLTLNLRNRTDEAMDVDILPTASEKLSVSLERRSLSLAVGEVAGLPFEVVPANSGTHRLTLGAVVKTGDATKAQPPLTSDLVAVEPGEVHVLRQKKEIHLVGDRVVLKVPVKGAEHRLHDRQTGKTLVTQSASVGPPFWPTPLNQQEFEVSIDQAPGRATATLRVALKELAGVQMQRVLTLRADGTATVSVGLTNLGDEERSIQARLSSMPPETEQSSYFPLQEGVVSGQGGLPGWQWFGPDSFAPLAARWIALEFAEWTLGVLWPDGLKPYSHSEQWSRLSLRGPELKLGPGQSWNSGEISLLPTRAGWREVERAWHESENTKLSRSEVLPAAGVLVLPHPLLLLDGSASATVEARTYYPRVAGGKVQLSGEDGLTVEPSSLTLEGVNSTSCHRAQVTVSANALQRRAAEIALDAQLPHATGRFTAPVIALGASGGRVVVEDATDTGERVVRVDNGWLSFAVQPSALATLYTLRTPDGEWLYSNFPKPDAWQWSFPLYGGIAPVVWEADPGYHSDELGRLRGLEFGSEAIERQGRQGVSWRGVRLSADLQHEALKGLCFEIEYLTTAESNVLAIATTIRSSGPSRSVRYSLGVYPSHAPEAPVLVAPDQTWLSRGETSGGLVFKGGRRSRESLIAEYPSSGKHLVLVNAVGDVLDSYDMGSKGLVLTGVLEATIPAGSSVHACNYVALADGRRQARLYASLAHLKGV